MKKVVTTAHARLSCLGRVAPLVLAVLLAFPASAASDTELAAIRTQLAKLKSDYEKRIAALEKKLEIAERSDRTNTKAAASVESGTKLNADYGGKAETAASNEQQLSQTAQASLSANPVQADPVGAANDSAQANLQPPVVAAAQSNAFNPDVSLILNGQYQNMKNIEGRQISGFWNPAGQASETRGFSLDETELAFSASIDPFWRGQATLALHDGEVEVEEAWFQSTGLGNGLGLKVGRVRSGIGYLNEQHEHAWDFADAPLMYKAMFGDSSSYTQDGIQLKWVAPTPVFLEIGTDFGRGANFPGTDRNKNGSNGGAVYAHIGDDIGESNSWRAGLSWLQTSAKDREADFSDIGGAPALGSFDGGSKTWIADFVWKWSPEGNASYRNFKLQGEYFERKEQGTLTCSSANSGLSGGINSCAPTGMEQVVSDYGTRQSGGYLQGVYQFTPNWRAGVRYDRLNSGTRDFSNNAAHLAVDSFNPTRISLMADYNWSEFSRLRLQYAQDKSMQGVTDNQIWLQYVMSLGAHGAHKF